jgi:hypothetical protein
MDSRLADGIDYVLTMGNIVSVFGRSTCYNVMK